jgi:hypothetical protein
MDFQFVEENPVLNALLNVGSLNVILGRISYVVVRSKVAAIVVP